MKIIPYWNQDFKDTISPGGDPLKNNDEAVIPFPFSPMGRSGAVGGSGFFDPLGSYTGLVSDPDETPVQDADDL